MMICVYTYATLETDRNWLGRFCDFETRCIFSILNVNEGSQFAASVDLSWTTNSYHWFTHHFAPVSDPTKASSNRKDHAIHVGWNLQSLKDKSTVIINVRE